MAFKKKQSERQQSINTMIARWNMPLCLHLHAGLHKISLCPQVHGRKQRWTALFPCLPETAARLMSSGFCKRMLENGTEIGVGGGGGLFCKAEWRSEQTEGTHFVVHTSSSPLLIHLLSLSFPCVEVPQILPPSALIIKTPTPYSLSLAITYTLGTHCPLV